MSVHFVYHRIEKKNHCQGIIVFFERIYHFLVLRKAAMLKSGYISAGSTACIAFPGAPSIAFSNPIYCTMFYALLTVSLVLQDILFIVTK